MDCRTSGLLDKWNTGPISCRTSGLSTKWVVEQVSWRISGYHYHNSVLKRWVTFPEDKISHKLSSFFIKITKSFKYYVLDMIDSFYDIEFKMSVDPSCLPNAKDLW